MNKQSKNSSYFGCLGSKFKSALSHAVLPSSVVSFVRCGEVRMFINKSCGWGGAAKMGGGWLASWKVLLLGTWGLVVYSGKFVAGFRSKYIVGALVSWGLRRSDLPYQ